MNMISVASTNLRAIGYDTETQDLEVHFENGLKYRYRLVPAAVFDGLLNAPSKGQYFNRTIKDRYRFIKL